MILIMDVIATVSGGIWTYGFGAFILPLTKEFGWSRAEISLGITLSRLEGSIEAPLTGYLTDRFGPRVMMLIGLAGFAAGLILLSFIDSLLGFYLVLFFMAIGYGLGFFMPMVTTVANWFRRKVGKAMGLFQAGYGGCGLLAPVIVWLIAQYGWRITLIILATGLVLICLPATLAIKRRPEDYGYIADGDAPVQEDVQSSNDPAVAVPVREPTEEGEYTVQEALRSRAFWFITLAHGFTGLAQHAVVIHEIPYLVSVGISEEIAALGLTFFTISSTVGRLGFGWLSDFFPRRFVMAACFGLQLVGMLVFANVQSLWLLALFLILFPPGYGGQMPIRVALQREYYGRKAFGITQGVMILCAACISSLGPFLAGWVFDVTGSYRPAFWILSLPYLVAIALIIAATPPQPQENLVCQAPLRQGKGT